MVREFLVQIPSLPSGRPPIFITIQAKNEGDDDGNEETEDEMRVLKVRKE